MKKIFSMIFLFVVTNFAFALTSTSNGELSGEKNAQTHNNINNYNCWAQTTCDNGQTLYCSVTGSYSCRWEASDANYVLCESQNVDGTGNRFYFTCPTQSCTP